MTVFGLQQNTEDYSRYLWRLAHFKLKHSAYTCVANSRSCLTINSALPLSNAQSHALLEMSLRYDAIQDAILMCAQKLTLVNLIYRTEPKTKKWKKEELKSKKRICSEVGLSVNSPWKSVESVLSLLYCSEISLSR